MTAIIIISIFTATVIIFLMHPKFGKRPSGKRLERIKNSPHYRDGKFHNLSFTPDLTEGETLLKVMKKFLFEKDPRNKPTDIIPSQKTDLFALRPDENVLVWFGHSSYFMQIDGQKFLIDPVFSGAASPIPPTTRSYKGTDIYTPDGIPEIDYLFITHDHWDHLDYDTIVKLRPKIKSIITGLGTGAHLERWDFNPDIIIEKDWNERIDLGDGFIVNTTTARHFSGRLFIRNQALWMAFALKTPTKNIYLGGDSGYDSHFAEIGKQFGPFDLAILECGQYDKSWKYIHLLPDEIVPAAKDLGAKLLLPVHWGKFSLANHAWDEPIIRTTAAAKEANLSLLTPMIGEKVNLNQPQLFEDWWKNLD
jgi:L-ascorbate metabolism protein UlaG (beta-lactamase superfamily)